MDRLTKEQRHKNMKNIRSKDTSIELKLRKELWRRGYRYRKNCTELPGKPDIVLTKYKIAIFCDSEFFHGKDWEVLKPQLEKGKNAGFPCQAFSLAGKRMGFDDDYKGMCRGTLFQDVVRICEFHKPKVIFCENVKGLTIHDGGRTFKVIKKAFEQIGYTVYDKVLNSKDFGVPQNRERIYIVAFRNNIDSREFHFPESTNPNTCIRDIMEEYEVSVKYYLSTVYIETLKRHKARHEAKGNGFGYEIRNLDGKAGAIVCGGMGRERNLIIDKRLTNFTPITHIKGEVNREGIRKMTPREWARLQGFPDDFRLELADTHLYKQLGNSVTVNVIEEIAKEIRKVLENDK